VMHGREKSDFAIVAMKPANKAGQPAAEWVERRAEAEGNMVEPRTRRTLSRASVPQRRDRVRRRTACVAVIHPRWEPGA
jgi:RNA-directed DNA polymerase